MSRRAEIVRRATEVFERQGVSRTSFEDIAQAVGIKREAIYYYFKSRADLLLEVIVPQSTALLKNLRLIQQTGLSSRDKLHEAIRNHLDSFNPNYLEMSVALREDHFFDDDARLLFPLLPDASIGRTFVLFADPWPKKRHFKRRFIADENLDELARLLKDGAELRFASDHMGYVGWTLERLGRHPAFAWTAKGPQDWRRRPEDGFETRYEAKALQSGATCAYLQFTRLPRRPVSS